MNKRLSILTSALIFSSSFALSAQDAVKHYPVEKYNSQDKNVYFEDEYGDKDRAIPSSVDLMDQQTEVKNQDQRGTCAFFSSTALIESELKRVTSEDVNASEEFLIRYAKAVSKQFSSSDGSNAGSNLGVFRTAGFALEKNVPYQPDWFGKGLPCEGIDKDDTSKVIAKNCYSHGKPSSDMLSKTIKLTGLQVRAINPNYNESLTSAIKRVLAQGRSVVVSVPVNFNGWDKTTGNAYHSDKLKKECDNDPDSCGAHSVLVAGYNDDLPAKFDGNDVRGAFFFKNSWGRDWGQEGYGKFPYQMINDWGYSAFEVELPNAISLPTDHSVIPEPKVEHLNVAFAKTGGQLITTFSADLDLYPNAMFYVSSFIADSHDQIVSYNGSYPKAVYYYDMKDTDSKSFADQKLTMDLTTWENATKDIATPKVRFSTYVYTDTDSWKIISREFIPFN